MTAKEFDRILQRYLQDTATEKEKVLVEEWFNAMEQHESLDPILKMEIQDKIWKRLNTKAETFAYGRVAKIAAAVSFLIVATFGVMKYNSPKAKQDNRISAKGKIVSVLNDGTQSKRVDLPDGSYVILEPNSAVDYPESFGAQREVSLEGEAFFQVKKNPEHPFVVYAHEVTTKVLGTSFTVKASEKDKEIVVAVKTGKVAVHTSATNNADIILLPNQKVVFNRDDRKAQRHIVDEPQVILDQSSLKSSYVNEPVVEILQALELNYGVDILFDEKLLAKCTLTSDMSEVGLYERIEIICHAIGASYQVSEVTVVIDAKPCD
jgi:transmembrane sensor